VTVDPRSRGADYGLLSLGPFLCFRRPASLLLGLVLVAVGYFGPWVPHETAALTVTGVELAEFAKFFPQVQGGGVPVARELFYLPLVSLFVLLSVFVARSSERLWRFVVPLCLAASSIFVLFPYSVVESLRHTLAARVPFALDPAYAGQTVLVLVGTTLVLLGPLTHGLPRRVCGVFVVLLALAGVIPPLWQFALLRPLVVALYTGGSGSLGLGWGLVTCAIGFVLLVLSGVFLTLSPDSSE